MGLSHLDLGSYEVTSALLSTGDTQFLSFSKSLPSRWTETMGSKTCVALGQPWAHGSTEGQPRDGSLEL